MNYSEAKEIISTLISRDEEYSESDKRLISEIHRIIYKADVADCNCKSKYKDAVIKMAIWFKHNTAFNTCHYVMAAGEAFMVGLTYYNNSNLTDEVAEKLIAENPRARAVIEKVELPTDQPATTSAEEKETASNEESVVSRKKTRRK